jgi:hypothetical protein
MTTAGQMGDDRRSYQPGPAYQGNFHHRLRIQKS